MAVDTAVLRFVPSTINADEIAELACIRDEIAVDARVEMDWMWLVRTLVSALIAVLCARMDELIVETAVVTDVDADCTTLARIVVSVPSAFTAMEFVETRTDVDALMEVESDVTDVSRTPASAASAIEN